MESKPYTNLRKEVEVDDGSHPVQLNHTLNLKVFLFAVRAQCTVRFQSFLHSKLPDGDKHKAVRVQGVSITVKIGARKPKPRAEMMLEMMLFITMSDHLYK